MFDVSPISRKFKSQSLAKPSRNCSDACSVASHRAVTRAGRWRRPVQNGDFGPRRRLPTTVAGNPGFGDVRLDSKCQKTPRNSVQKLSVQKTWNQKLHHVSRPAFNLWMVNFRSWLDEMYRNVMSNFVQ